MIPIALLLIGLSSGAIETAPCSSAQPQARCCRLATGDFTRFDGVWALRGSDPLPAPAFSERLFRDEVRPSTFGERFAAGVLGGTAGVMLAHAAGLPRAVPYTAGSIGGILMATAPREGIQPAAVVLGSGVGLGSVPSSLARTGREGESAPSVSP
jgi:hypothetical protein